jgi:hypothetical protein
MQPDHLTPHAAARDLQQHHGLNKILRFFDLGGTITPPSDDPQDWWEPENLTHRAELLGICKSGDDGHAALLGWIAIAAKAPPPPRRGRSVASAPSNTSCALYLRGPAHPLQTN